MSFENRDLALASINAHMTPHALGVLLHMATSDECNTAADLAQCQALKVSAAEATSAINELVRRDRYRTRVVRTDDGDDLTAIELAVRGEGVYMPPRYLTRVYFVQSNGFIKIGTTGRLNQRLEELYHSGGPHVSYVGSIPGGPRLEAKLHQRFAEAREMGEWFSATAELWDYIYEEVVV